MFLVVVGYKCSLGVDVLFCSYEDFDCVDCVLIVGSNMVFVYLVLFCCLEVVKVVWLEMCIVVIDLWCIDICELVDLYLVLLFGIDVVLFYGILYILFWEDWIDCLFIVEYIEGFVDLKELVCDYILVVVVDICGIDCVDLQCCVEWIGCLLCFFLFWCMGFNQFSVGSVKNSVLINLYLVIGKIGCVGCGLFFFIGQLNVMGGCEIGSLVNLLFGYCEVVDFGYCVEVVYYWGVEQLFMFFGFSVIELFDVVYDGWIKVFWIVCINFV